MVGNTDTAQFLPDGIDCAVFLYYIKIMRITNHVNVMGILSVVGLVMFVLIGCGQSVKIPASQTDTEIFEQGKFLFEQGEYGEALDYFLYVKDNFLRSPYAGVTRFYAGECYYEKEQYDDAVIEYKSFLAFFPNDPHAPEAQYKVGASLLTQARDSERDQSSIQEALAELQKVRENYADQGEFVQKAEEKIYIVNERLAQYEFNVAKFYRHEKQYTASNGRLAYLMKHYPQSSLVADALWMQSQNFQKLEQPEGAKEALLRLWENYPGYEKRAEVKKELLDMRITELPTPVTIIEPETQEETRASQQPSHSGTEGYIVLRQDDNVFINLIREDGLKEGMELPVYRGEQTIGTIRVIEIQAGFSIAEIVSHSTDLSIREDDRIVLP